jgi:hypothetical protein
MRGMCSRLNGEQRKTLFRTTIGDLDYMLGQERETAHHRYLMTWETLFFGKTVLYVFIAWMTGFHDLFSEKNTCPGHNVGLELSLDGFLL